MLEAYAIDLHSSSTQSSDRRERGFSPDAARRARACLLHYLSIRVIEIERPLLSPAFVSFLGIDSLE